MKRKKIIITALLALFVSTVFGQKVGLVLSGGGAKGLYHIGVLRALEENQIPVDYIAGTSMGAIVSGLYATGYTPQQMNEIFTSDRVGYWMSGKIENDYYFYFKKARSTASMVNLLLDVEGRKVAPILPANLIPSRQIDLAFVEFFAGVNAQSNNNFDSLMIPFRCVATDLIGRREVVFSGGDMGQAIRASMTIPFVFRPLRKDSTLYYDGGIVNNFPWTVMQKDFAPDIIIGSKCTEGNVVPHEDNIIDQISAITMLSTNYELPSQSGILIEHAFSDVSMLDFSKAQYVIDKGYTDAMEMMPAILERISRRVDTTELAIRRSEYRASLPEVNFDSYTIEGVGGNQNTYIEKMLNLGDEQDGFKPFSFERFKTRYFRLLAEGDIDAFYPDVIYDKSKELFSIGLKLNNKPSLKFQVGGNVSSTSMNQAYLGLEYRLIQKKAHRFNLDTYLSALYTSVYLGGRTDFFMKFPWALEYGLNYNFYNYFKSDFGILGRNNDLSYTKMGDSYFTTAFSVPASRLTVMSLRFNIGDNNLRYYQLPNYGDNDIMDKTRFKFAGAKFEIERNNLNYLMFPTRGIRQSVSAAYIMGIENYCPGTFSPASSQRTEAHRQWYVGHFSREHYYQLGKVLSLGYLVEATYSNQPNFSNEYSTNITSPAFYPTAHSRMVYLKDYHSDKYVGAGLMPSLIFGSKMYLKSGIYAFLSGEKNLLTNNYDNDIRWIFTSALVYQTPIGPASLTLSKYNAQTNSNWFLTFNFGYILFNKRALFY